MAKEKRQTVMHIHTLVGNAIAYCESDKPMCANGQCPHKGKMKHTVSLYQYGMFYDKCIEVWQCNQCKEYTSYDYRIIHEGVTNNGL